MAFKDRNDFDQISICEWLALDLYALKNVIFDSNLELNIRASSLRISNASYLNEIYEKIYCCFVAVVVLI